MKSTAVGKRYGKALLDLAVEHDAIAHYEADLASATDTIWGDEALRAVWLSKEYDGGSKKRVIREVFATGLATHVLNLLLVVIDKQREAYLPIILASYKMYADEQRGVARAYVTSAFPLSSEQEAKIAAELSAKTGKTITLVSDVDPTLLGGIRVQYDDYVLDGSAAARLQGLKDSLAKL